jgi:excisionase family DNA binding protein
MSTSTSSHSQRRIVTQQVAAQFVGVHPRTIRNWISEGLITGYRTPSGRAIRVDLTEILDQMKVMPATMRPRQPFGPKAKIVTLVEEYRPPGQDQDQTVRSEATEVDR